MGGWSRGAKRQTVAEAVGEPPFSKGTRKARFFLDCSLSRQPRILALPLWSFHSRRHHISTYLRKCVAYEATNVGTLDVDEEEREGERFRSSRGEALCIGNFKSQPGNNSYVWIDSYYYKAYVGRACGTSRVCVPHRDRLAWLADRPAVWPQLPSIFAISLSPPLLAAL